MAWARGVEQRFGVWPLRCPVDDTWLKPDATDCPDCGLSTSPLRALAAVAREQLEQARDADAVGAERLVSNAVAVMPASEAFLIDCADILVAAGAEAAAAPMLNRATAMAPGRRDIKVRLSTLSPGSSLAITARGATNDQRDTLSVQHVAAREARDRAELGSAEYVAACEEVARIEVEIARLLA